MPLHFATMPLRDEQGAAMVEYVIVLLFVTIIAMQAMQEVGKPLVEFYLIARGVLIYPA